VSRYGRNHLHDGVRTGVVIHQQVDGRQDDQCNRESLKHNYQRMPEFLINNDQASRLEPAMAVPRRMRLAEIGRQARPYQAADRKREYVCNLIQTFCRRWCSRAQLRPVGSSSD
jgi:hypothetical protein